MTAGRGAIIDVGTNGVKLLVVEREAANPGLIPVYETSIQTRLGAGFYETQILSEESIGATVDAVSDLRKAALNLGVTRFDAIATSAVREAKNSDVLIDQVKLGSGLTLRVLTGRDEADSAFTGVLSDPNISSSELIVTDVGGGSTEVIFGNRACGITSRHSFRLGVVRLKERFELSDPPRFGEREAVRSFIAAFIKEVILPGFEHVLDSEGRKPLFVGSCGSATILGRVSLKSESYERGLIDGHTITLDELSAIDYDIWGVGLAERRKIKGIPADRADIIPFGTLVLGELMRSFRVDRLRISMRGMRFGIASRLMA